MVISKRAPSPNANVLATDLDGTLIPLEGCQRNVADLETLVGKLRTNDVTLVFVTGRHFESVCQAIDVHRLPMPDWIICNVGTTIYRRQRTKDFAHVDAYEVHLAEITRGVSVDALRSRLSTVGHLRRQEPEKQGTFKLSYYADAARLPDLRGELDRLLAAWDAPYSIIHSVDPFTGVGLIDFLPRGVSKAYALEWWSQYQALSHTGIIYAGDSGNDLAAFTTGYRTILVGNAEQSLARHVRQAHQEAGWNDRLYIAELHATSGVLAGCRAFGLLSDTEAQ